MENRYIDGGNLTDSQFNIYTNPLQEHSLSSMSKISEQTLMITPQELLFEDITFSGPLQISKSQKLIFKNCLGNSQTLKFVFSPAAFVTFSMDPPELELKSYESSCAMLTVKPKKIKAKLPTKIKEYVMVNEYKVNVLIVPVKQNETVPELESSNYSLGSSRYSLANSSRVHGGGMTSALQRMRSLSKEIKDQKRGPRPPVPEPEKPNFTASFNQEDIPKLEERPFFGQNSAIGPYNKELRADIDDESDPEEMQRGHSELTYTDMTGDDRDPNDQSLSLHQLEHSQSKSLLTQGAMGIFSGASQSKGLQRIIETQQKQLKEEISKRENLERILAQDGQLAQIQALLHSQEPQLEELLNLAIQQEKDKQAKKDQQVLIILKQKDKEIGEKDEIIANFDKKMDIKTSEIQSLQKSYKNACDEIQRLLGQMSSKGNSEMSQDLNLKQKSEEYKITIISLQEKLKKSLEDNKRFAMALQKNSRDEYTQTDFLEHSNIQSTALQVNSGIIDDKYFLSGVEQINEPSTSKTQSELNVSKAYLEKISNLEEALKMKNQELERKSNMKTDGLQYEQLVQLCEHLKHQNQKLQAQVLNIKDLDFDMLQTFGKEEVFNPYKTEQSQDPSLLTGYDPIQMEMLTSENIELKQQLIFQGKYLHDDQRIKSRDALIKQLREQLRNSENTFKEEVERIFSSHHMEPRGIPDSNTGEKELRLAINKLQLDHIDGSDALKVASETILKQKKELLHLQGLLIRQNCLSQATIINRILSQRQKFLSNYTSHLQFELHQKDQAFTQEKQLMVEMHGKIVREVNDKISMFEQQKEQIKMMQKQVDEVRFYKDSIIKKAEIEYDQRQKMRDEKIKNYFDTQVMKYLISSSSTLENDTIELTRQFCNLQLQIDSQSQEIQQLKAEKQGHEQRLNSLVQESQNHSQLVKLKLDMELLENMRSEIQNLRDSLGLKQKEIQDLKEKQVTIQFQSCFWKFEEALQSIDKDAGGQEQKSMVETLQKQMIEIRTQQLLEIEEIKTNCEIDLMEEKKALKRLVPGKDAVQILEENMRLKDQNEELKAQIESFRAELVIVEKKLEDEKLGQYSQQDEIRTYKEALKDLKKDICEPQNFIAIDDQMMNQEYQFHLQNFKPIQGQDFSTSSTMKPKSKKPPQKKSKLTSNNSRNQLASIDSEEHISVMSTTNQNTLTARSGGKSFSQNPPLIIQKLIESKLSEKHLQLQVEKCLANELSSRQEIRKLLYQQRESSEDLLAQQLADEKIRRHDLEMKVRQYECEKKFKQEEEEKQAEAQPNDYVLLVNTVVQMINKEPVDDEVYKLIIRQMTKKSQIDQYIPSDTKNQKIWYLELLDSQLSSAESMVSKLMDYVKRLQIDIQGSLTSAAQIKATSMDLAQNTSEASSEIKMLKHVSQMIRADLEQSGPLNPFATKTQMESEIQSQLNVATKVKHSLEQEIISLKKQIFNQKNQLTDEISQITSSHNDLQLKLAKFQKDHTILQSDNQKLVQKLHSLQSEHKSLASQAIEELDTKDRERGALAKNQSITSKNLSRLQQEMHEWRKTTDENLKLKDAKIQDLQRKADENQKLKAENSMLRKNQKEWLGSTAKQMEQERNQLQNQIDQIEGENQTKIYGLKHENEELKQRIEELENELDEQKGEGILAHTYLEPAPAAQKSENPNPELENKVKKLKKKLQQKDDKVKELEQNEKNLQNDFKILAEQKDKQIAEMNEKSQQILNEYKITIKELQLEKQMMQKNHIETNDVTSLHIQQELESLRHQYSILKVENLGMLQDLERAKSQETQWRSIVDNLKKDIDLLQTRIKQHQSDQLAKVVSQDQNHSVEIKFLKNENLAMKQDNKIIFDKLSITEQILEEKDQQIQKLEFQIKESSKQQLDLKNKLSQNKSILESLELDFKNQEVTKFAFLTDLQTKIEEIKESKQGLVDLYESQLAHIKQKMMEKSENKKETELTFQISQKDAQIKVLKKENLAFKGTIAKNKAKIIELKKGLQTTIDVETKPKSKKVEQKVEQKDFNSQCEEFASLIQKVLQYDDLHLKMVETSAHAAKTEGWNLVLVKQNADQEKQISDMRQEINDLLEKDCNDTKLQKMIQNQQETIKNNKQDLKNLELELSTLKQTWFSPDKQKIEAQLLKDLQFQLKSLKEESNRKKDLIASLKNQKEQFEKELKEYQNEVQSLKDENNKINKQIRSGNQAQNNIKMIKSDNETLKMQLTQAQSETNGLNEKIKSLKSEVSRLKTQDNQKTVIVEKTIESPQNEDLKKKIKELKHKSKLENEIKENQIRSLKIKIEQQEDLISSLEHQDPKQDFSHIEKKQKQKLKNYDKVVKKSLNALQKLGISLSEKRHHNSTETRIKSVEKSRNNDVEEYKQSMDILGVSLDELEEFMNPQNLTKNEVQSVERILDKFRTLDPDVENSKYLCEEIDLVQEYCMKLINQ